MLLIFDCDGVLVDSETLVCDVHVRALRRIGLDISRQELARRFLGMTDRAMYAELAGDLGRALPADYDAGVKAEVRRRSADELAEVPGAAALLADLSCQVCVASSSAQAMLGFKLERTGLARFFGDRVFSADRVTHGKPAPDIFLYAAAQMGAQPSDCIVVEDSENGVRAARAAGMRTIGFVGGGHLPSGHEKRLREAGADAIAADFTHLAELLPQDAFAS